MRRTSEELQCHVLKRCACSLADVTMSSMKAISPVAEHGAIALLAAPGAIKPSATLELVEAVPP